MSDGSGNTAWSFDGMGGFVSEWRLLWEESLLYFTTHSQSRTCRPLRYTNNLLVQKIGQCAFGQTN
jgi:hypothetical protein